MIVREIDAPDTYNLRSQVLRPGISLSECEFEGDKKDENFHLGAFVDSKLVSIASFYLENHKSFEDKVQYRLRGMATLEEYRHKGYSASLIQTGIPITKRNQASLIWCNARVSAAGFYEKIGFVTCSKVFDIKDIGPHVRMKLELK